MSVSPLEGKGKGKSALGALPGPSDGKIKGKGKSQAKGGFAPNLNKKINAKPWPMSTMQLLSLQSNDGHFDNAEVGRGLLKLYTTPSVNWAGGSDPGIDFSAALDNLGPAGGTAFVIGTLNRPLFEQRPEDRIKVTVQSVGNGRGDVTRESYVETQQESTPEEKREQIMEFAKRFTKHDPPALGDRWLDAGEAYLQGQPNLDELMTKAQALRNEWFQIAFEKKPTKAVSEEDRKRKEEEQRQRNEAKQLEQAKVDLHWRSLGSRSIEGVPWDTVKRARWCSGGMGGATLVQLGDSEAVVLKRLGLNPVAEVIAGEVSTLLGVRVARSRPICATDAEFGLIMDALAAAPTDGEQAHMLHQLQQASKVVVMEYVAGCVLQGIDGNLKLQSDAASSVLAQLGGLIALDCLLNNVDRVPAIWLNDGNFSNVMITEGDTVIGIDQQVNVIGDPTGKERYLKSVHEFVADAAKSNVPSAAMTRIRVGIFENTGIELSDEMCRRIFEGAFTVFRRIGDSSALGDSLTALSHKMRSSFSGQSTVEKITAFIMECVGIVKDALESVGCTCI